MRSESKTWNVVIANIGLVEVKGTKDIDSAYVNAVKKYKCSYDDVLAVFGNPISMKDMKYEQA